MTKENRKYLINIVWIIILTAAVLIWLMHDDFEGIISIFINANDYILMIALAMMLVHLMINSLIVTNLVRVYYPRFRIRDTFKTSVLEQFARGITPYQTGGQMMQGYGLKSFGVSIQHAVSILSVEFIVYQVVAVLFALLFVVLKLMNYRSDSFLFYGVIVGTAISGSLLLTLYLLMKWSWFHRFFSHRIINLLHKLKMTKDKDRAIERMNLRIQEFAHQFEFISNQKKIIAKNVVLNIIGLLVYHSIPFVIALAFRLEVSVPLYFDFLAMSVFVSSFNALIPVPGATGGTEAVFVIAFSYLIKTTTEVKSLVVGWRFITFYFMICMGAIYFVVFNAKQKRGES